ncbi:peptidoglycan DD-metalloendopeptidase family protein [Candidatus Parcubacteria bacterium]|nr:peptidoglycan DD-metalloendopeptidase family protein [Candidatus Parcubacteria bacterium]
MAQAAFFSINNFFHGNQSQAAGTPLNSQTMPLLAPANNIDPHPPVGGADITVVDGSALLAESTPSVDSSELEHPASSQISVHVVREGETLSEIASMYGVKINTIIWANDIQGRYIHPGQELIILPITGVRHTVASGETLASIVKKYKGDLNETAQYNEIATNADLAVGTIIIIPDGVVAPAPTASGVTAPVRSVGGGAAAAGYYMWPVPGGVLTQGLHGFNGVDIGAHSGIGTAIVAAADGTVIVAKSGGYNGGYGSYVVLQHSNGTQTLYAHASQVLVTVGDQVSRGQTIERMGMTGKATGPHVHFEVRGAANPFR